MSDLLWQVAERVAILLLGAILGAVVMGRRRRRIPPEEARVLMHHHLMREMKELSGVNEKHRGRGDE